MDIYSFVLIFFEQEIGIGGFYSLKQLRYSTAVVVN